MAVGILWYYAVHLYKSTYFPSFGGINSQLNMNEYNIWSELKLQKYPECAASKRAVNYSLFLSEVYIEWLKNSIFNDILHYSHLLAISCFYLNGI